MRVGAIGLGDMGSGFTQNLIANGFEAAGLDPREARMSASHDMGGTPAGNVAEVGGRSDVACVTVMNGDRAEAAIQGGADLAGHMAAGGATGPAAPTEPREPCATEGASKGGEIRLRDSSNSGGNPGTQAGAFEMMASAGMRIIRSAMTKCPQGKNLARARATEEIVGTELNREGVQ